ncbi:MAG TPA: hydantoinase/oxoprolinase family protein [Hyphomicrobiaceae bacterium]|nr:hydantoinase/oxoprolinase family protein [Hyphomicrobiaceae bacterium]
MGAHRVTVDTGGTFSDFVFLDEASGKISILKLASTPDDPSRAILHGIEHLISRGVKPAAIGHFCHGTTVGTNALLEGKGARTGLLVTEGFRGIYEVAEQARPHGPAIFDVMYEKPPLIVPQSRTGEVRERVAFDGEVLLPLDEAALRETLRELASRSIESMAVCLLFSFLRPEHERRVRDIVAEEMPGCNVSLSSEVVPQIREYYRLSTTVINAYLQPILARYIERLGERLAAAGLTTRQKYIMQSNGGTATFEATAKKAVTTVLSGPAGGVTAGVALARATGIANIITFDMGGTSCDVALIAQGEPIVANLGKIEGRDLAVPMMDINTVSAGGGTIARIDRFGALKVGPESAGAVPGPACYGRGGTLPTITDCNLALGFLSEDGFLGGQMRLDRKAALAAIETAVARPLGLDALDAAEGIIRIINVKMEEAIKAISTIRGHDLREFMLLAFGGAGPIHAGDIARSLRMAGVIVPLYPGVFSALGLLMSDVRHDYVRSKLTPFTAATPAGLDEVFVDLERQAVAELKDEGFAKDRIRLARALDLRYAGQGYELTIPCPPLRSAADLDALRRAFDAEHRLQFGHAAPEELVEIVTYRVRSTGLVAPVEMERFAPAGMKLEDAVRERRQVRFAGRPIECPVYRREQLDVGLSFAGPAIVEQLDCTTVVNPGQVVSVDAFKNLIISEAERQ